jgi:hypothetical protein
MLRGALEMAGRVKRTWSLMQVRFAARPSAALGLTDRWVSAALGLTDRWVSAALGLTDRSGGPGHLSPGLPQIRT